MSTEQALGLIECLGFIEVCKLLDSMSKNANIKLLGVRKLTGGYLALSIVGNVDDVKHALEKVRNNSLPEKIKEAKIFLKPNKNIISYFSCIHI